MGVWAIKEGLAAVFPTGEADSHAERIVIERLSGMEPPRWDPGADLEKTTRPPWEAFPPPPLWRGGSVGEPPLSGRALELATQGRREWQAGNLEAAATSYLRAANLQPTWEVLYSTGLVLLDAGDAELAVDKFGEAEARLQQVSAFDPTRPVFHAALVANRYAAGQAYLQFDCLEAIFHLRRSVSALDDYVDVEGALVRDRRRPFQVSEAGIDNQAVWATLARAYERCEGKFPDEYERRRRRPQDFGQEYRRADRAEVRDGPFANALAACITDGKASRSARCWAFSNLNKPIWASQTYFARPEEETVGLGLSPPVLDSLARLVYDAAWLAADSEKDRPRASTYLGYAARLDRKAEVPGLANRIATLGRYLAPTTKDYSFLAEPWRRHDLTSLTLDARMKPEDLKGAAWALQERWLSHLRGGQPGLMIEEIEAQIRRSGPYGKSLLDWKGGLQGKIRETLVAAMRTERQNGNLPAALAIREYEAPWLGPGWSSHAFRAWLTWRVWLRWVFLLLLWLLVASGVWLFHRLFVFPYLVYTTDFYRLEHQRRLSERRRQGKPFTRDEIEGA